MCMYFDFPYKNTFHQKCLESPYEHDRDEYLFNMTFSESTNYHDQLQATFLLSTKTKLGNGKFKNG